MTTLCAQKAKRTSAYIRKLHREIQALQQENASQHRELVSFRELADEVRATSTSQNLRTHADVLLSPKRLETV